MCVGLLACVYMESRIELDLQKRTNKCGEKIPYQMKGSTYTGSSFIICLLYKQHQYQDWNWSYIMVIIKVVRYKCITNSVIHINVDLTYGFHLFISSSHSFSFSFIFHSRITKILTHPNQQTGKQSLSPLLERPYSCHATPFPV